MITVTAERLRPGDRIEGREEVARVSWDLDPDDTAAAAQILAVDTEGREYLFDRADRLDVERAQEPGPAPAV